jgi:hypothetical protein
MAYKALRFLAGSTASEILTRDGFDFDHFQVMAGASGGPKWLALSRLDRVLCEQFLPARKNPLFLLGSSIGAWRFSCYAKEDPLAAIEIFEDAYVEQRYAKKPTPEEVTRETRRFFKLIAGVGGEAEMLGNPRVRLNVMTVRCRGAAASEHPWLQGLGLIAAAAGNLLSRKALSISYERVLFFDPRDEPPFGKLAGIPMHSVALSEGNLEDAVVASGSIPLVLTGVPDIVGAPPGMYRDGGVVDYHFSDPLSLGNGLVLYPHFYPYMVPGWFDKSLPWRRARGAATDKVLLISPSEDFVGRLPFGKIPDRKDFESLDNDERIKYWRKVVAESERMADELRSVVERGVISDRLEPLG